MFTLMQEQDKLPEDWARFYVMQVAVALGYLHQNGIVYRGMKPENILMKETGYISIADFGNSKEMTKDRLSVETSNNFDMKTGASDYTAPEMLDDESYGFQVDWWSVGILAYDMIVGHTPFATGNRRATMMKKKIKETEVYLDVEKHGIKMSSDCKDFIQKLL